MGTNIPQPVTSSQKICDNDYQMQFKDKDTEVWKLSDILKAPQLYEAERT